MMKVAFAIVSALAAIFCLLGFYADSTGRSADERLGALVFYIPALFLGLLDAALLVGWSIYRLFSE